MTVVTSVILTVTSLPILVSTCAWSISSVTFGSTTTGSSTVTFNVTVFSPYEIVIVVVPLPTAVTNPFATVATFLSSTAYVAFDVTSSSVASPSAGVEVSVTLSCAVSPTVRSSSVGFTDRVTTGSTISFSYIFASPTFPAASVITTETALVSAVTGNVKLPS